MSSPTNRIATPFGAESTAAEVLKGIDLSAERMIVTGASSGIGVETVRKNRDGDPYAATAWADALADRSR